MASTPVLKPTRIALRMPADSERMTGNSEVIPLAWLVGIQDIFLASTHISGNHVHQELAFGTTLRGCPGFS